VHKARQVNLYLTSLVLAGASSLVSCVPSAPISPITNSVPPATSPSPPASIRATQAPSPTAPTAPSTRPNPTQVTWTPLPTLDQPGALELVTRLQEDNGGCRLPCWWGITPGETSWAEARQFLETFASSIETLNRTPEPGTSSAPASHYVTFSAGGGRGGATVTTMDGAITGILSGPTYTRRSFNLGELLRDYGPPTIVLLHTFPRRGPYGLPFGLVLYYQHDRFLALYDVEGQVEGDEVEGCFGETGPHLWTWSDNERWDLNRIRDETLGVDPTHHLRRLEDVTQFDIPRFSLEFLSASACLRTPAAEWDNTAS
jgi:hypothetical protein